MLPAAVGQPGALEGSWEPGTVRRSESVRSVIRLPSVVSEETGAVSTAYKGQIEHDIDAESSERTQLKQLQNRHREPGKI